MKNRNFAWVGTLVPNRGLLVTAVVLISLLLILLPLSGLYAQTDDPETASQNFPPPVQTYYVPAPEDQLLDVLNTLNSEAQSPVRTLISIVAGADDTFIYYDHWEDGYELNAANPQQSSTEIWGDGNSENGMPPGYDEDILDAGSVIVLENDVPLPRDAEQILFDGRDHIAATTLLAVTRAGWPTNDPGSQLAGAIEVYNTNQYGQEFIAPVGVNIESDSMFEFTGLFVMAQEDNTQVTLTSGEANTRTVTLGRGESQLYTRVRMGDTVEASAPVQVYLLTGDIQANYEARFYTLFSRDQWSDNYYSPVSTTDADRGPADLFVYNPFDTTLEVQLETLDGLQEPLTVEPNSFIRQQIPQGSGVHVFTEDEREFFALATIDSSPVDNQIYDWGFTLIPDRLLSPSALVGWGPGNLDRSCTPDGAEHPPANPVWVVATADAELLVDYDSNPTTGDLTDANGNQYDEAIMVSALEAVQLFDSEAFNGDFDQTGLRVYVIDENQEANVVVSWGQDPSLGTLNSLCNLDLGTSVLPIPNFLAAKSVSILDENGAPTFNEAARPGDMLEYRVIISQQGPSAVRDLTIQDDLPQHTTYVENSVTVEGPTDATIPDQSGADPFPLNDEPVMLGDLGVGEQFIVSFQVVVDFPFPEAISSVSNQAIVRALGQEARPEVDVPVEQSIDLLIDKQDDVTFVRPGETFTYTLTYQNMGDSEATGVMITDTVPANVTFAAPFSDEGWSCAADGEAGDVCTLAVDDLPARSEMRTAVIAFTVDEALSEGTLLENVVTIGDDGLHGPDTNPENNTAEEDTPVPIFDANKSFELIEDVDGDDAVDSGDTIRYRILITQTGSISITNVTVFDELPEFTNYVSGSATVVRPEGIILEDDTIGTPFPLDENEAGFALGDLGIGEVAEIVFDVQVDECFVDRLFNTATVSSDAMSRQISTETPLDTGPDLALLSTSTPTAEAGDDVSIDITYVNVGNSDAEEVTLMATIPPFASLDIRDSDLGWVCDDGVCTLQIDGVAAQTALGQTTLALNISSDVDDATSFEMRLRIRDGNEQYDDPSPGNNILDLTIPVE